MAGKKIVELPSLGRNLAPTDILELSENGAGSYKITGQEIIDAIPFPEWVSPDIEHNANPNAVQYFLNYQPYYAARERIMYFNSPYLPNDNPVYKYILGEFTGFNLSFDNFSFAPPTEINIYNDAVVAWQFQGLWGSGFTMNYYGEYFPSAGSAQGCGYYNLPNCVMAESLDIYGNPGVELNAPLVLSTNNFNFGGNVGLINLPSLEYVVSFQGQNANFSISVLELLSLKYINSNMYLYGCNGLVKLDMPNLKYIGSVYINLCSNLDTMILPELRAMKTENPRQFEVYDTPLNQASVDSILIGLDTGGQYNGTINLASLCAAPSGAGVTAKNNLISKGWSVSTN